MRAQPSRSGKRQGGCGRTGALGPPGEGGRRVPGLEYGGFGGGWGQKGGSYIHMSLAKPGLRGVGDDSEADLVATHEISS